MLCGFTTAVAPCLSAGLLVVLDLEFVWVFPGCAVSAFFEGFRWGGFRLDGSLYGFGAAGAFVS
jgi:hypothetical protein